MKKSIELQKKHTEEKLAELKAKLMENYCHQFSWLGEEIFKLQYNLNHYNVILDDLNTYNEETVYNDWVKQMERYLSHSFNVRENSTGSLFRECSTWKYICTMDLLNYLKQIK